MYTESNEKLEPDFLCVYTYVTNKADFDPDSLNITADKQLQSFGSTEQVKQLSLTPPTWLTDILYVSTDLLER